MGLSARASQHSKSNAHLINLRLRKDREHLRRSSPYCLDFPSQGSTNARRLAKEHQFNRYDLIEATLTKASNDGRPESFRVDHDSIRVIERGTKLTDANNARLWQA